MRRCLVLVCLLLSAGVAGAADDKVLHFVLSGVFGAGSETVLHHTTEMGAFGRITVATVVGTLPGLGKEIADSGEAGNEFDAGDLAADVLGAFCGAVLSSKINDWIEVRLQPGSKGGAVAVVCRF